MVSEEREREGITQKREQPGGLDIPEVRDKVGLILVSIIFCFQSQAQEGCEVRGN